MVTTDIRSNLLVADLPQLLILNPHNGQGLKSCSGLIPYIIVIYANSDVIMRNHCIMIEERMSSLSTVDF